MSLVRWSRAGVRAGQQVSVGGCWPGLAGAMRASREGASTSLAFHTITKSL
jgi:hypothetical protein